MNRTKNAQGKQQPPHRHSLIPTNSSSNVFNSGKIGFYPQVKPRRASAYPVLEGNEDICGLLPQTPYPPPHNHGRYPIAPMPSTLRQEHHAPYRTPHSSHQLPHHPPPPIQSHHRHISYTHHPYSHQRKPSAIDLLASAAEYVRTDHKEITFSRS